MFKKTIKTKMLIMLVTLVGIVSLSLLSSQYYFSKKIAIASTDDSFNMIVKNISEYMKKKANDTRHVIDVKSKHKDLLSPITFEFKHPALQSLIQILQYNSNLHAVYFAQEDGHYFEVINMRNREKMFDVFQAPKETYWTVVIIIDNVQQSVFLNEAYQPISKKTRHYDYDPLKRPWYTQALHKDHTIATPAYLFSIIHEMGITYAKKIKGTGTVIAADYTITQLNDIFSKQKMGNISEIFMVDNKGNKFVSSNYVKDADHDTLAPLDTPLKEALLSKKINEIIHYNTSRGDAYVLFSPLATGNTYLGITVDAKALLKSHRDNLFYSLMIAFVLLLMAIPFILFSADRIVKPVHALIKENKKIEERKFSEVQKIDTDIVELDELSGSLVELSRSVHLHTKAQDALLESIIKLIAEAIDNKSPYTGKHCERVPVIATLLLQAANKSKNEVFKDFSFESEEALREFEIGAWLHDCGKVTTPAFVVDKSVKLETIYNRIHEIRMRFEVLWRDAEIAYLKEEISQKERDEKRKTLQDDFAFIASVNMGSEFMSEEKQKRVKAIAKQRWKRYFDDSLGLGVEEAERYLAEDRSELPVEETLLCDKVHHIVPREDFDYVAYEKEGFKLEVPEYLYNFGEVYNLCIAKGTLTEEERYKINEHVIVSIKMLEKIPFPEQMKNIVEYAGTHHETLIGTGYPRKLTKDDLSVPARIMAIADIFEALTAADRPYKKEKTLSEAIKIMHSMVEERHIDKDLFALFLRSGVYKKYAEQFLKAEQIDEVDVEKYLL